jgi:hypothetical protein
VGRGSDTRSEAVVTEGMRRPDSGYGAKPVKQIVSLLGKRWQTILLKNSQRHAICQHGCCA